MDLLKKLGLVMFFALLAACSTPQERAAEAQEGAYKAQERVSAERLKLVEKYQDCVKVAAGNQQKADACNSYLKAAEALK